MSGHKLSRATQDIKRELSVIFRTLKDPRISPMLSVVKISLTNDLSHCTVYVSAIEGFEQTKQSVEGLTHARGLIRTALAKRVSLRRSPELEFIADDSIEYGAKINQMLEDLHRNTP